MRITSMATALVVGVALWAGSAQGQVARLQLQSDRGDYIGQGGTYDITYTAPADTVSSQIRRRTGGLPSELLWVLDGAGPGNDFATVFFGTDALNAPIQAGTYLSAQRADFASPGYAGLDVSFQNRGSNTLTGSFTIDYVTFDPTYSKVQSFKAEFVQHSEGAAPALTGTFTYNAAVPEPASTALILVGVGTWMTRRRRRALRSAVAG